MFKKLADLSPYWMQIDYSKVNNRDAVRGNG